MIRELLENKNARERTQIKSQEIAKLNHVGKHIRKDLEIEIISVEAVELGGLHGVQVFARAWKNGEQIGFGADGTVDIERFRIWNPPYLVPDGTKKLVANEFGILVPTDNLKEDLSEAVLQVVEHAIRSTTKNNPKGRIVSGKTGNTTDTFYPEANPETNSWDGEVNVDSVDTDFGTLRTSAGSSGNDVGAINYLYHQTTTTSNQWSQMRRCPILFYTGATIPSGNTISSATLSIYFSSRSSGISGEEVAIVSCTPGSVSGYANSDYNIANWGSTDFATRTVFEDITLNQYTDYTLNASGLANIAKGSGTSKFGMRFGSDVDNSAPTWASNANTHMQWSTADGGGSTTGPKLVVVSSSTSIKSWNGLAKASVKTHNGLAIASVKTIDGLN